MAPMASIEGHYRGPLEPEDAPRIVAQLLADETGDDLLPEKRRLHENGSSR
jgi:hypothetical protein